MPKARGDLTVTNVADIEKITNLVPGLIAVYEIGTGKYVFVNKALKKILGYQPEEFLQKGLAFVATLVHPDDLPAITARSDEALAKINSKKSLPDDEPIVNFEYRMRHKNGRYVWFHTTGSIFERDAQGRVTHLMNISIDITERKNAEAKLLDLSKELERRVAERSERLELAVKASHIGIWEWNIETGELVWSDQLKKLFGIDPAEPISYERYLSLLHPDDRTNMRKVIERAMKSGKEYDIEHRAVWADGSVHWIQGLGQAIMKNGKPVRMIGCSMNIDDRKESEIALKHSEERYRSFVAHSNEAIWRFELDKPVKTDMPVKRQVPWFFKYAYLAECNDSLARMYGYAEASDIIGARLNEFMLEDDPQNTAYLSAFIRSGYRLTEVESVEVDKDGHEKHFLNSLIGVVENDYLVRAWGIQRDVTEQKRISKQKDEFIAIASHELKTPVTSLKAYTQILQRRFASSEDHDSLELLVKMNNQLNKLNGLVTDLLDISKIEGGKLQFRATQFDLNDMLLETIDDFQRTTTRRTFTANLGETVMIHGDRDRISQVLTNLVLNAVKYSTHDTEVIISSKVVGDMVEVSVQDFGIGMSKHDAKRIFERFYRAAGTANDTYSGLGLGLYIASEIVNRHNGKIWVESEQGRGSTFFIQLPFRQSSKSKTPRQDKAYA